MREDEWLVQVGSILPNAVADEDRFPTKPVIALFGTYDAGKSTLLKRLLVEAGVSIPSWLTVSARRETFESNDVEAFGCILRDTPGLAAGSAEHEEAALQAVLGADVMLLVMPPQLITGERDVVLPILSGKAYRKEGLSCAQSLLVVIAKLDERADPVDDQTGYHAYAGLKREEWSKLIESNGLPLERAPVFTVSADPLAYVGSDVTPQRGSYMDGCRDWDGISALVGTLEGLPRQLAELRRAARIRRLCSKLTATIAGKDAELLANHQVLVEAERQHKEIDNLASREKFIRESAQAELRRKIEEELSSFFTIRGKDATALRDRLQGCVQDWLEEQSAELEKLVRESGAEFDKAATLCWRMGDWSEPVIEGSRASASPDIRTSAQKAFREFMDLRRLTEYDGKSVKDYAAISESLGKKITDLQIKLDQANETTKNGIKKAISTLEKKKAANEKMLSSAKTHEQMIAFAPLAIEGFSALAGWWSDRKQARISAADREERQQAFTQYGRKAAEDAWAHIGPAFDDFAAGLELQTTMLADIIQDADHHGRQLANERQVVHALLANAPSATATVCVSAVLAPTSGA